MGGQQHSSTPLTSYPFPTVITYVTEQARELFWIWQRRVQSKTPHGSNKWPVTVLKLLPSLLKVFWTFTQVKPFRGTNTDTSLPLHVGGWCRRPRKRKACNFPAHWQGSDWPKCLVWRQVDHSRWHHATADIRNKEMWWNVQTTCCTEYKKFKY
jgi:hypothetical protein